MRQVKHAQSPNRKEKSQPSELWDESCKLRDQRYRCSPRKTSAGTSPSPAREYEHSAISRGAASLHYDLFRGESVARARSV